MQEGGGPLTGRLAEWLSAAGAPEAIGVRIVRAVGENAADRVADDPWCVLEVPGVAPQAADALARAALEQADPSDPRRTRALISWLLRRAAARGHTVQGADVIADALAKAGVADPTGAVADAIDSGTVLPFAEPVTLSADAGEDEMDEFEQLDAQDDDDPVAMLTSGRTLLALERWAFAEQSAAEAVQRLVATPEAIEAKDGAEAGAGTGANAESMGRDALTAAVAANGLTLVTGVRAAELAALAGAFPNTLLASPAPGGVRTLAAAGADVRDARALGAETGTVAAADVVILADAQLVDIELGTALLEAVRDGAHLVLAGDPGTMAPVGPGLLFRDLLEVDDPAFGGKLPRVELKRRPTGPLSALADSVRHGGLPPQELLRGPDESSLREVVIVPVREGGEAVHRSVQLVADSIPRAIGVSGDQVQVVAPLAEGAAGTGALNSALKQRLNPGPGVCGGFDAGDRVVVAAAMEGHGLLRGETGTVSRADGDGVTVVFDFPLGEVQIGLDEVGALRHAWALTVAEAQGGRWPAVVAVFDAGSAPSLTRAMTLGAITLATQHLSVVHGAGRALAEAVENVPDRERRTRLRFALKE
jgi:helix-hairpin-helix protein